ncbi:KRAB-A domain-containing protein 2-like [Gordionus sp. m RMFG-2023]|uniref:KRAB-A domain-containing protein 2-like n=1 Tax=Gordionus sp. m RMFG-2023 TaxID=3053472 RepID=UPI0031FE12D6
MQSFPIPSKVWTQIGVDLCSLPHSIDGFKYAAVDYFLKYIEAQPIKDKTAHSVTLFLYSLLCRHGRVKVQIYDQGREFVNQVSNEYHKLVGTQQRVTSAYHPQANGMVERANRTLQNSLLKCTKSNEKDWPGVLPGIVFAYNSRHESSKFTPYEMMYARKALLPCEDDREPETDLDDLFDTDYDCNFQRRADNMEGIFKTATKNIIKAQLKQQRDYKTHTVKKITHCETIEGVQDQVRRKLNLTEGNKTVGSNELVDNEERSPDPDERVLPPSQ